MILNGVTQAAEHLHAHGLMHGDLYAHNILWGAEKVVLSDLGGASFLPLDQPGLTQKILSLEARALNILSAELQAMMTRSHEPATQG
jgi:serine/threonine protein kinase